jgi:transposase
MKDYRFLPYEPEMPLLLPPDIRKWLLDDHLALFINDVVDALEISGIVDEYLHLEGGHPAMSSCSFRGYGVGICGSRRIERKTYEDVALRVLSCDSHPDHSRISDFRKRHLSRIQGLFLQVLQICREAGLVKLGHVAGFGRNQSQGQCFQA